VLGYFLLPFIVPFALALIMPEWRSLAVLALIGGALSVWGFNDASKDGGFGGAIATGIVFCFTCGLASGVMIRVVTLARK